VPAKSDAVKENPEIEMNCRNQTPVTEKPAN
jgi:hypothetical protein